ncbi:MAG: restriction endonuclease [Turicibacter sp.]|jgi:hypothetical protein|uniref:restriction endonuclease n=1 Tax=Turicibacter sp. KK003 TaxID=3114695 RepID=UPI00216D1AA4|nr:restriction endonuclease [Turicibacter sp.]MCI9350718.1 restriction endonuclease [Turicibacter sp.]
MNDLNEGKVLKLMSYIMLGLFAWVTYFNFQGVFIRMVELFESLPMWWYLLVLVLFAVSVVWSISRGEEEIHQIEEEMNQAKQSLVRSERCLRLLQYEVKDIPTFQFSFYCADLLRMLDYQEVRVKNYKFIRAINEVGEKVYIGCFVKEAGESVNKDDLSPLLHTMKRDDVFRGLIMTIAPLSPEVRELAKKYHILCLDDQAIQEIISFVTREGAEMLEMDFV